MEITGHVRASTGEPLRNVLVSNGRTVTRTRADGGFALEAGGSGFVWVTRPNGFATLLWFRRVTDATTSYDFILEPTRQPVPFTFAQVTDLHLCVDEEPTGNEMRRPLTSPTDLAGLLAEIAAIPTPDGCGVAFVAVTGDLTDRGVPAEFAALAEVLGAASIPVEILPGNHDHYGHQYEPRPDDRPIDSHGMGTGTVTRYEENVGPRWWSMDYGGVHFAAIDWFGYRLGEDLGTQEEWLHADLAAQSNGTPVVLLVHDQMKRGFFERLRQAAPHVRLLGSFSGHWHTCRTVVERGVLHANTGNATFGSCDFTPPQYRLCIWDGTDLRVRTVTRGGKVKLPEAGTRAAGRPPTRMPGEVWSVRLPGAAHAAAPLVAALPTGEGTRELVFAAWGNEEDPEGGILVLDAATGAEAWRARLSSTVRAGAVSAPARNGIPSAVISVSVSGEVLALDALGGGRLWRRQVGDPLHMWVYQEPLVYEDILFVGDIVCYKGLDLRTGETVWERSDLGRPESYVSFAHPVVQADTLLLGFMNQSRNTWGLDPRTGAERWSSGEEPLLSPMSGFLRDPDGEHVYTVRFGGVVEKLSAVTGERRWKVPVDTVFAIGQPALTRDASGLVVTSSAGTIYRLNAKAGEEVWRTGLRDEALLPMGPYRKSGPVAVSGPTVTGSGILQATCGGTVYRVDPGTGEPSVAARLDAPIAAPLALVGEDAIAVGTDGVVRRLGISG